MTPYVDAWLIFELNVKILAVEELLEKDLFALINRFRKNFIYYEIYELMAMMTTIVPRKNPRPLVE